MFTFEVDNDTVSPQDRTGVHLLTQLMSNIVYESLADGMGLFQIPMLDQTGWCFR